MIFLNKKFHGRHVKSQELFKEEVTCGLAFTMSSIIYNEVTKVGCNVRFEALWRKSKKDCCLLEFKVTQLIMEPSCCAENPYIYTRLHPVSFHSTEILTHKF